MGPATTLRNCSIICLLLTLLATLPACRKQEQHLTPGAEAFRTELLAEAAQMTELLTGPMAAGKGGEVTGLIATFEERHPLKMGVGVIDTNGILVGGNRNNPSRSTNNYASTHAVAAALKGKTASMLLFYQDGSRDFVVCVPLRKNEKVVGVLGIYLTEAEARAQYGLTEQEFRALTFTP